MSVWPRSRGERARHAVEALGEQRTRAPEVQTDKTLAAGAEQPAVVQRDLAAIEEEREGISAGNAGATAVEPGKIRRLRRGQRDARQPARHLSRQEVPIPLEIAEQRFQPGIAVAIRGDSGGVPEDIDLRNEIRNG